MEYQSITIPDLLNTDYLEYAKYVVHSRALPYLADGFKPTQRKIIYTALKRAKDNVNVSAFSGYIKAEAAYHHADSSLDGQIVNLAQDFKCAMPYFEREGQFGSVYDPTHAATRYLEIRLSKAFELLFLDNDLIKRQWEEGKEKEPEVYLPILPTVLFNSIPGIGVGFSFGSTNRNPLEVAQATLDHLKGKKLDTSKPFQPCIHGLTGKWIWQSKHSKWEHHGFMQVMNTTTVEVTGLALGHTYDSYESHLNSLLEKDYIVDWSNYSNRGAIKYELKFTRKGLQEAIAQDNLYHVLKMYSIVEKDNFTVINSDGKPHRYENDVEVLIDFVNWRRTIYTNRKALQVSKLTKRRDLANEIIRFIEAVNSGKIKLDKMESKASLISLLESMDFVQAKELSEIKVYKLTVDEIAKLKNDIEEIKKRLLYFQETSEIDLYITDVKNLIKQLKAEGFKRQEFEIW